MTGTDTACRETLISTATRFRLGMEAQACEGLVKFIDGFVPTLAGAAPEDIGRLTPLLNELMTAQSRKDYLRVADLLEYEILPFIDGGPAAAV